MRKVFVVMLSLMIVVGTVPSVWAQPPTGGLEGYARTPQMQVMPKVNVQVRGADGQLAATGTTNSGGLFSFSGLPPGTYTVEILDGAGRIVGTSSVNVTAGAIATVNVTAAAAGAIAAAGTGGLSLFGLGTIGTVAVFGAAAALTLATIVATRDDASPSR